MAERVKISFDDDHKVRVLDQEQFKHTAELAEQCTTFVDKIREFNEGAQGLISIMEAQAERIERVKSKAIGQRNRLEAEPIARRRKQYQLQQQIHERMGELDRLTRQLESLEKLEKQQTLLIEKLGTNEV